MIFNKYGIKTSVVDTKFSVNEKKGCVTCILTYRYKTDDLIEGVLGSIMPNHWCYKEFEAVGVARLNDVDIFDSEIGKKVARARAESVMYRDAGTYINDALLKLQHRFTDPATGFILKAGNVIEHNDEYISQF